uniref:Uncharacterized protein n=1 Tax=Rangifer tarandus platyrhynchus TaxID=3082113 RepID=A0ACB0EJ86_RANTA|nr:unnamed protein product [Rangifer tarandus platyrhynchus]
MLAASPTCGAERSPGLQRRAAPRSQEPSHSADLESPDPADSLSPNPADPRLLARGIGGESGAVPALRRGAGRSTAPPPAPPASWR